MRIIHSSFNRLFFTEMNDSKSIQVLKILVCISVYFNNAVF